MENENYITKTISIKDIDTPCPDLKNTDKTSTIAEWFINWIESALSRNKIHDKDILPSKSDLAYMLGVSIGTVQNAIRTVEDRGYLTSKQKKGTFINAGGKCTRKLTSKRDAAINYIKRYLKDNNFKTGEVLPSSRKLAQITDIPLNTIRSALQGLATEKIIEKNGKHEFILIDNNFSLTDAEFETLVEKVKKDIENYITSNCKISDKLPPNKELAKMFDTGIKTINDAVTLLVNSGVLVTLRGRYGTIVSKMPSENNFEPPRETSIFAPAAQTAYYYYEKTVQRIKRMITENYYPGSKLPSIIELSKMLDLSPNTVRRAIKELAKEGILASTPGRWGGTFVIKTPAEQESSYQWIAVSSDFISDSSK